MTSTDTPLSADCLDAIGKLLDKAIQYTGATESSLLLCEQTGLRFTVCRSPHREQLEGHLIPPGNGLVSLALAFQQPMIVSDVKTDPSHDPSVDTLTGSKTLNQIVVPVSTPQKEYGVLTAINAPTGFQSQHLEQICHIAAEISIVLRKSGGDA